MSLVEKGSWLHFGQMFVSVPIPPVHLQIINICSAHEFEVYRTVM